MYNTSIIACVLINTWSLTLKKSTLRMVDSRALREEVTGGWRKLHNEKLHILNSSPNEGR
jgi:hypothetical protein